MKKINIRIKNDHQIDFHRSAAHFHATHVTAADKTKIAPVVVSKEMQEYWGFYNILEVQIKEEGLEADYAQRYMNQKKLVFEEYLKSKNKPRHVTAKKLDAFCFEGERAFRIILVQQFENVSYKGLHILLAGNFFYRVFAV